jgi:hypothetical protein
LGALSWTVPGTELDVAWEAPWPFSLVRPLGTEVEDMMIWFVLVVVGCVR